MLGWAGFVLIILAGLSFLIFANPGDAFGMTSDQFGELAYLSALAAAIGGSVLVQYRGRFSSAVRHLAMWLGIALAILIFYTYKDQFQTIAMRVAGTLVPGLATIEDAGTVTLRAGRNGHFTARVQVNGTVLPMLVDTGASVVTLTYEDARKLGFPVADLSFSVAVRTANGETRAARIKLREVALGSLVERNVTALVTRQGRLDESLLGMSFINRLRGFELRGDILILKR